MTEEFLTYGLAATDRKGPYSAMLSGRLFYPADPRPGDFFIEDIAAGLAKQCRFSGQTKKFYSVAQHLTLCAQVAPPELKRQAFAHDWAEAYLQDIARPIKKLLTNYYAIEAPIEKAIAAQFGLQFPLLKGVEEIDNRMLVTEASQLQTRAPQGVWWEEPGWPDPYDFVIDPWSPELAEDTFLATYHMLFGDYRHG